MLEGKAVHVPDVLADPEYTLGDWAKRTGLRSTLGVPLVREGKPIAVMFLARRTVWPFTAKQIELATTFADQAVIAIENARLFEEVQARTRELAKTVEDLEIASQHKNQFVANMSHELRTPLAAILGYAELIQEGFYEPQGPKSVDALTRICSNGKHLLGLINTVLDIAKIESGQFTLNMTEYAIESVVETVRAATESPRPEQEAHAHDLSGQVAPDRARRRATPHAGATQSRGQCHQVHRRRRGEHRRGRAERPFRHLSDRYRARHTTRPTRSDLRSVPPGRQFTYQGQGRYGPRPRHRQADRGDARRPYLGGVDTRQRIDVSDGGPHAR